VLGVRVFGAVLIIVRDPGNLLLNLYSGTLMINHALISFNS
jgi:hypothetical protein